MCTRFYNDRDGEQIAERFEVKPIAFKPTYNAAPTQELSVILDTTPASLSTATWGFHGQSLVLNARAESIHEKPMFKDTGRCLVPATGFFEWKSGQPFKITCPLSLFAFAGLWRKEIINGKEHVSFVILTSDAKGEMAQYHYRMPFILPKNVEKEWLQTQHPKALLSHPVLPTNFMPVDKKIGNSKNNSADLLKPLNQLNFN
ncbi:MAG TPA: SOS response-associated peptidase [Acidobacteriota bacterium]|nr:SOS response-associated peptidase [Acidobacteriota bacterium]